MRIRRVAWRKLLGNAVVVIASVYVAIVLEGMADDRARTSEATDALTQLLEELRQDRKDLAEVAVQQAQQTGRYADLRRWFAAPSSMPLDSVSQTIDSATYLSRTLFPRNASWTMMVAGGQLSLLADRALVTRLADLYENGHERMEVVGMRYDDAWLRFAEQSTVRLWDAEEKRLLADDQRSISVYRNELRVIALWNQFYREFLTDYAVTMEALIVDVEAYLQERGRGT